MDNTSSDIFGVDMFSSAVPHQGSAPGSKPGPVIFWEYDIATAMVAIGVIIIGIVGVVGNFLIILILGKKAHISSTDVYLINMAFVDLVFNLIGRLYRFLPAEYLNIDPNHLHPILCKLWAYIVMVTMTVSGWSVMAVTFERLLVVYIPLKVKNISTKGVAIKACAVLDVICLSLYLVYFWSYGAVYKKTPNGMVMAAACSGASSAYLKPYMKYFRPWQDFMVLLGFPFAFILVCNTLIIYKMIQESKASQAMTGNSDEAAQKRSAKNKSVTITLLTVSFTYLFCLTPHRLMLIIDGSSPFGWKITEHWQAVVALRWAVAINISHLNYAINFFLYCLCGGDFRNRLVEFFNTCLGRSPKTPQRCSSMTPQRGSHKHT